MTTLHSPSRTKKKTLHREILISLVNLSPPPNDDHPPPENTWAATRQIADAHDISIYKARLLLLELTHQGLVVVTDGPVNNSLRWYPDRAAIYRRQSMSE
ncbi:FaeA/PapI family transcriptional regulator [Serratia ureilytica]|uniref:FaeA/PapI family transcriptional regulator n=1 Tax=Serratia ureilytica TaxID=300181 RepID=UPI0018E8AA2B|nr:FaeA/PapI family transcriptional regulator [Serratia ureilytica]MBJ2078376.1 hypothetical protein [Serratia ureilytica]